MLTPDLLYQRGYIESHKVTIAVRRVQKWATSTFIEMGAFDNATSYVICNILRQNNYKMFYSSAVMEQYISTKKVCTIQS